jgi:hypothetical protein
VASPASLELGAWDMVGRRACVRCTASSAVHIMQCLQRGTKIVLCTAFVLLVYCSCAFWCALQVTEMVEGEIATATKEVPRFAAGGAAARSTGASGSSSSSAAARIASRRGAAARYSRFEAEVGRSQGVLSAFLLVDQLVVHVCLQQLRRSPWRLLAAMVTFGMQFAAGSTC